MADIVPGHRFLDEGTRSGRSPRRSALPRLCAPARRRRARLLVRREFVLTAPTYASRRARPSGAAGPMTVGQAATASGSRSPVRAGRRPPATRRRPRSAAPRCRSRRSASTPAGSRSNALSRLRVDRDAAHVVAARRRVGHGSELAALDPRNPVRARIREDDHGASGPRRARARRTTNSGERRRPPAGERSQRPAGHEAHADDGREQRRKQEIPREAVAKVRRPGERARRVADDDAGRSDRHLGEKADRPEPIACRRCDSSPPRRRGPRPRRGRAEGARVTAAG